jgi:glycosyltransferase involved in cell wall biosynthesis
VFFKGEQPPHVVCEEMKESDFFVLFSNFETASVVICEALATGLPIVSSAVCQIPIMVRSDIDMLVPPRDSNALAQAMLKMMTRCRTIDRNAVRGAGMKYNYNVVGQYLTDIYREAISRA